jgi:hypothetical protein
MGEVTLSFYPETPPFSLMQKTMTQKTVKLRCLKCGAEHFVTPTKPGLHLFVCQHCGAQHAMILDTNLDLRDFRLVEQVETMPAGLYEVVVTEDMPITLRDLLAKFRSGKLEDVESAIKLAKKLGLLRVVG